LDPATGAHLRLAIGRAHEVQRTPVGAHRLGRQAGARGNALHQLATLERAAAELGPVAAMGLEDVLRQAACVALVG
jgi:hypothetical protein